MTPSWTQSHWQLQSSAARPAGGAGKRLEFIATCRDWTRQQSRLGPPAAVPGPVPGVSGPGRSPPADRLTAVASAALARARPPRPGPGPVVPSPVLRYRDYVTQSWSVFESSESEPDWRCAAPPTGALARAHPASPAVRTVTPSPIESGPGRALTEARRRPGPALPGHH